MGACSGKNGRRKHKAVRSDGRSRIVDRSVDRKSTQTEKATDIATKVSLPRRSFGMAIGIRLCARQQLERRISDSELDGACHAIEFSVDLTTPLSHEAL